MFTFNFIIFVVPLKPMENLFSDYLLPFTLGIITLGYGIINRVQRFQAYFPVSQSGNCWIILSDVPASSDCFWY